jgi:hypothetical protein
MKKNSVSAAARQSKKTSDSQLNKTRPKASLNLIPKNGHLTLDQSSLEQLDRKRLKELPKEIGVMLIAAGIVGVILPGPGTPALIAGGLALWPGVVGKLELWLEQHHPTVHDRSMKQIGRFLNDLEKRYPYSQPR